jgi:hypothetical protein
MINLLTPSFQFNSSSVYLSLQISDDKDMPTTPDLFQTRWTKIFANKKTSAVDIVASFDESFLNDFLSVHFEANADQYKIHLERDFNDHNTPRKFVIDLNVTSPLKVFLPPFPSTASSNGIDRDFNDHKRWIRLPITTIKSGVIGMDDNQQPANVRVTVPVTVRLQWPKLDAPGDWIFPEEGPLPLNCLAEAFMELKSGPVNPDKPEILQYLQLTVRQIKFAEGSERAAKLAYQNFFLAKLVRSKQAQSKTLTTDEQKFKDLLIIAMNVAATEYAPKIIQTLPLPTPVFQRRKLYPALFDLGEKLATLGFSLDVPAYVQEVRERIVVNIATFERLLEVDLDAVGGLMGLEEVRRKRPTAKIEQLLPRSTGYIETLKKRAVTKGSPKAKYPRTAQNAAIGVDEFILNVLVSAALPPPKDSCTGWCDLVVVRGRICYWVRLYGANVTVSGDASGAVHLGGSINVNVGGVIEACVRNPLPCTGFRWECRDPLSLSVEGVPGVELSLRSGSSSIKFSAKLTGDLYLSTKLPWPFDKVIKELTEIVSRAVIGIINIILEGIEFDMVPPEIDLSSLNMKLRFENFSPSYYERPNIWSANENQPESRRKFMACAASAIPKKARSSQVNNNSLLQLPGAKVVVGKA